MEVLEEHLAGERSAELPGETEASLCLSQSLGGEANELQHARLPISLNRALIRTIENYILFVLMRELEMCILIRDRSH